MDNIRERFGKGPYGPDWTSEENAILLPLYAHYHWLRWCASWMNDPHRWQHRINADQLWDLLTSFMDALKQAEKELQETRQKLRPERLTPDGKPYKRWAYASTAPKYDRWTIPDFGSETESVEAFTSQAWLSPRF